MTDWRRDYRDGVTRPTHVDGVLESYLVADGSLVALVPLVFGAQIATGAGPGQRGWGIWRCMWDYDSSELAAVWFASWNPTDALEPGGWVRAHSGGQVLRRRTNGNPELEYLELPEADGAVCAECGAEACYRRLAPPGAATSTIATCGLHTPR